jgi:hypothetical protein
MVGNRRGQRADRPGRRLCEKGAQKSLVAATGFPPEKFALMQSAVAELRDNLIGYAKGQD